MAFAFAWQFIQQHPPWRSWRCRLISQRSEFSKNQTNWPWPRYIYWKCSWRNKQKSLAIFRISPALSIHQIPLFNTLSGLWQLYFPCKLRLIDYSPDHCTGTACCWQATWTKINGNRLQPEFWQFLRPYLPLAVWAASICSVVFSLPIVRAAEILWACWIAVPIFIGRIIGLAMLLAFFF